MSSPQNSLKLSKEERRTKALELFTKYFVENYPGPHTVISDPKWHAPKIFRAAISFLCEMGLVASSTPKPSASRPTIAQVVRRVIGEEHRLNVVYMAPVKCSCGERLTDSEIYERHIAAELEAALDALLDVDEPIGGPT
jgi:hypothetical protein